MKHALICPVCANDLSIDKASIAKHKSLSCTQGHLFDYAKQGYLNLLLSQHKKSKHPGDTLEMVQARTHFLDSGFYDSISDFLIHECIEKNLPSLSRKSHTAEPFQTFRFCDLACGDGFYTQRIHNYLAQKLTDINGYLDIASAGIDISTPAIKAACHRSKDIQWLISSLARTALADNSQDLVTGLFFHFDLTEIKRILKQDACFIMVTTGPSHLIELREKIYDTLKEEKIKDFSLMSKGLQHTKTLTLKTQKNLSSSTDILSLLTMTPHYWRCTQEKKHKLELLTELNVTLDIQFDIFTNSYTL